MDKTTAGLLGAVATLATIGVAQASTPPEPNPSEFMQAGSYADLLAPVQNATALIKADDAIQAERDRYQDDVDRTPENVRLADWNERNYDRRAEENRHHAYYHQHHRYHHDAQGSVVPGTGVVVR
jgi:hypothetical protein